MLEPGERIDVWVVEQVLGSGGMGAVYRCHNYAAARILAAVKVLEARLGDQPALRARFVREAELLFGLSHPNIVKVRNIRMDASPPFIEMDFVEGEPLDARIARGPLPELEVLRLGVQLSSALAHIHARQVAHRDIKPGNLLLRGTHLTLVDFGIAAEADGTQITSSGQHMGTLAYVPPEWGSGQPVDPYRWDLYALGLVLHECLTGATAFPVPRNVDRRQGMFAVMAAKREHPPLDPGPGTSAALRALIRELTHSDPEHRLGSAAEANQRLSALLPAGESAAPVAARGSTPEPVGRARSAEATVDVPLDELEPPPTAPRRGRSPLIPIALLGTAGIGAIATTVLGAAVLAGSWRGLTATERDLVVELAALPEGMPVALSSGALAARPLEPEVFLLPALPLEPATLVLEVGGDCAHGCLRLEREVAVEQGDGPQRLEWALPERGEGRVAIRSPGAPEARIGDLDGNTLVLVDGKGTLEGLEPGAHTLWAQTGACTDAPCGEDCPEGCLEEQQIAEIPWEGGEIQVEVGLVAPAAVDQPRPSPTSGATREGHRPSRVEFATFLEAAPDWSAEAARARGDATAAYLRGWVDGAPPPPGTAPMTDVSWAAAEAFCASRGGLASVDAPPSTWSDSGGAPWLEHRQRDGRPAWRRSDGVVSEPSATVSRSEANPTLGLRCRR